MKYLGNLNYQLGFEVTTVEDVYYLFKLIEVNNLSLLLICFVVHVLLIVKLFLLIYLITRDLLQNRKIVR